MRLSNLGLCIIVVLSLVAVTGSGQMGYSNQQSVSVTKVVGETSGGNYLNKSVSMSMTSVANENPGSVNVTSANLNKTSANVNKTSPSVNVTLANVNKTSANVNVISTSVNKTSASVNVSSGRDYLNPNLISSGYNSNFPWYSSTGPRSFYSQGYSDSTFSPFREYYASSGTTVVSGIISTPIKFDIAQKTPSRIYFGTGQPLPYTQYVSTAPSRTNELWVQGATDWSQYVVSPLGTWLQLVAYAPVGGSAGFYEIVQTDTTTPNYKTYQFYPGYNTMNFNANQVGRHILLYVVNNQPSNVVIVDVFAQAQPGSMPPSAGVASSY